jgi:hypothetical protein
MPLPSSRRERERERERERDNLLFGGGHELWMLLSLSLSLVLRSLSGRVILFLLFPSPICGMREKTVDAGRQRKKEKER